MVTARSFQASVASVEPLSGACFLLGLDGCDPLDDALPGQFVMVRPVSWQADPLLPRPLSLLMAGSGKAELLVAAKGRGTALMSSLRPGDKAAVLGPLGSFFPPFHHGIAQVLVAGGVGLAPLVMWLLHNRGAVSENRAKGGTPPLLLYGGRTRQDLLLLDRLKALDVDLHLATEDGSKGEKGLVTDLFLSLLGSLDAGRGSSGFRALCCGPAAMMARVARICSERGAECYVSLENRMACGRGVCLGCALFDADGETYLVCKDGPVMPSGRVDFTGL